MFNSVIKHLVQFGFFVSCCGLLSSAISLFGYELSILAWIENWGFWVGWLIRLALIIGGVGFAIVVSVFASVLGPGESSGSIASENAERQAREKLVTNPRLQQFLADLAPHMKVSFAPTTDPEVYVVRKALWVDAAHSWFVPGTTGHYTADDPRVVALTLYLERAAMPQRIAVSQVFATRQLAQPQVVDPRIWNGLVGT